jgi:hypothetical protein
MSWMGRERLAMSSPALINRHEDRVVLGLLAPFIEPKLMPLWNI